MKIHTLFTQKKPVVSLELFPPKKAVGIETLYHTLPELADLTPDYISVTYGAGGSLTNNKTLELASKIQDEFTIPALHHLTCISNSKEQIHEIVDGLQAHGIENILALRGDLPADKQISHDFRYAKDLISEIKSQGDFSVAAACYPEGHISQFGSFENLDFLKQKVDAGADFFVSQLFFNNDTFYRLKDAAIKANIDTPIEAGIMPMLSKSQLENMCFMCGSSLPSELIKIVHRYEESPEDLRKASLDYAVNQMDDLVKHGVDGVHVYSMNHAEIAQAAFAKIRGEQSC